MPAPRWLLSALGLSVGLNFVLFAHVVRSWMHAMGSPGIISGCRTLPVLPPEAAMDTDPSSSSSNIIEQPVLTSSPTTLAPVATKSPTPLPPTQLPTSALDLAPILQSPKVPLFMGRIATSYTSPFFSLDSLTTAPRGPNDTLRLFNVSSPKACCTECTKLVDFCSFWVLEKKAHTCFLHRTFTPKDSRIPFELGLASDWASGPAQRSFNVWSDASVELPRSRRTLMVVNWHWGLTGEKLMTFGVAQFASLPRDIDVVHASALAHSTSLLNVWSCQGYLSYMSLVLAKAALPGYRGYLFSNDDAFMNWVNMPLAYPMDVWHAGGPGNHVTMNWSGAVWSSYPVPVLNLTTGVLNGNEWGYVWGFEVPPNHISRNRLGMPKKIANRSVEALQTLLPNLSEVWRSAGHCDVVYIPGRYMDLTSHWLTTLASFGTFLEVALSSTIFLGLVPLTNATVRRFAYYSINGNERRDRPWSYFDERTGSMHPAKLSDIEVRRWLYDLHHFGFGEPLGPGYG